MKSKALIIIALAVTSLLALAMLAGPMIQPDNLRAMLAELPQREWVRTHQTQSAVIMIAGSGVATAFGFPRQAIAFSAGFLLAFGWGVVTAILGTTIGAALAFLWSRYYARPWVRRRYQRQSESFDRFVAQDTFTKIVIIRFLPFGTNLTTNLAAGISSMKLSLFLLASIIGFLPHLLIFTMAGHGIQTSSSLHLVVSGTLFAISLALSTWVYHRQKNELLN